MQTRAHIQFATLRTSSFSGITGTTTRRPCVEARGAVVRESTVGATRQLQKINDFWLLQVPFAVGPAGTTILSHASATTGRTFGGFSKIPNGNTLFVADIIVGGITATVSTIGAEAASVGGHDAKCVKGREL